MIIGAFFFWLLNGFNKNFSYYNEERFRKRNLIVVFILGFIFILIYNYLFTKDGVTPFI